VAQSPMYRYTAQDVGWLACGRCAGSRPDHCKKVGVGWLGVIVAAAVAQSFVRPFERSSFVRMFVRPFVPSFLRSFVRFTLFRSSSLRSHVKNAKRGRCGRGGGGGGGRGGARGVCVVRAACVVLEERRKRFVAGVDEGARWTMGEGGRTDREKSSYESRKVAEERD